MDRVPVELWERILGNLEDPNDFQNAYKTCKAWENALLSTRQMWLFREVFPLFLEHLTKTEILASRLVCQQWCYGVEHFLQNNAYHRPSYTLKNNQHSLPSSICSDKVEHVLDEKQLKFHGRSSSLNGKQNMLLSASGHHPRNPILGRAVLITERSVDVDNTRDINSQYLRQFGYHIWFMEIEISYPKSARATTSPGDHFKRILELLSFVPNLKKLSIQFHDQFYPKLKEIEHELTSVFSKLSDKQREKLPKKLETLEQLSHFGSTSYTYDKMFEILFSLLATENLESLTTHTFSSLQNVKIIARNLVDVHLYKTDTHDAASVDALCELQCPLKRLSILLHCHGHMWQVAKIVNHFKSSLSHLRFDFLELRQCPFPSEYPQLEPFFKNETMWMPCHNLKKVTLCLCDPVPLNFLIGLASNSLEQLSLFVETDSVLNWRNEENDDDDDNDNQANSLDLLKYIHQSYPPDDGSNNRLKMYESNVWRVFPKLRLLLLAQHYECGEEEMRWEYRRDIIYDKLNG